MIEVLIIICLAAALFFMLRRFPQTGLDQHAGGAEMQGFWAKVVNRREVEEEKIKEAISNGQDSVVAPSEISDAQQRYMESDPKVAKMLFEADEALAQEDLRTAEHLALEILKHDKRSAQAYVIVGRVAGLRGEFEDAKEAYRTAIKCNPELSDAHFGLGEIEYKGENFGDAINHLQKAVVLDRSQPAWLAVLGKAYLEVRQFAKAAKALKRATVLDMENKEYRELAIQAEEKQRSHAQAFRSR